MSTTTTLRAAVGLALALALAVLASPALGGAGDTQDEPVVRAAAARGPVIVGDVDEAAIPRPSAILAELGARVAAEQAAAEQAKAIEALAAAEEAAKHERLAAAIEAQEAEEARRAEEARAAAAAPAAAPGTLDEIIQRHFGDAYATARRIAECESGMNPNAVSPTNDHGLFQINAVHRGQFEAVTGAPWSSVYDPELNTIYARYLYGQQGWGPWTCA